MNIKKSKKLMLAATVVIMLNFTSCKKYEDGPMFSLKSKTARLSGEWEVIKIDGEDQDGTLFLEFDKDGDFKVTFDYGIYSYSISGDWEWRDNKEVIEVTIDDETDEFTVTRLTDSELWFEDEENDPWECEKK